MCPEEEDVILLLDGALPEAARARIEAHLDTCDTCRRLVALAVPTADLRTDAPDEAAPPLSSGSTLSRYVILETVGAGGMGAVYAAYDPELDRKVAVKVLWARVEDEEQERRVLREAQAMARLSHPNVVSVHDVGVVDGRVFIVMEFVRGTTLRRWIDAQDRSVEEVLDVFRRAGAGLAAAHAEGLVHRDFKPDNVLIGKDGRVLVTDFGLARSAGTAVIGGEPGEAPAEGAGARVTATVAGTPAYMAPEQLDGAAVDPRSDVFAFCVSLHEALHGERPFEGAGPADLRAAIVEGRPRETARGARAPAWVRRVVREGISADPAARPASMPALLAALARDPEARTRARRRRAGLAAAAAAVIALGAVGLVRSGAFRDPCVYAERELSGAWDADVEGRVRAAFLGTGRTYAGDTLARVTAILHRFGADWSAMRGEVCEASRRQDHPKEVLALRDACLEGRRGSLRAVTTLFADHPDPQVLDRAVAVAEGLPPVATCGDVEALTARVRPPEDPAVRARVDAVVPRVERVEALTSAGKITDATTLAEALLEETKPIAYPALRARVLDVAARLRAERGDFTGARAALFDAIAAASEAGDDVRAGAIWADLLLVVGDRQARLDEAALLRPLGEAQVARAKDPVLRARWLTIEGGVLTRMGKYADALTLDEQALALTEKLRAPDAVEIADVLSEIGRLRLRMGDAPRARSAHERALAIREKALGPQHPSVALSLDNLGLVLADLKDLPGAKALHERAITIYEGALGPDAPSLSMSYTSLGNALLKMGDPHGARAAYSRSLAVEEKAYGRDHPDLALILNNLGTAASALGDYPAAKAARERAVAIQERALGPDHPELGMSLLNLAGALSAMDDSVGALAMHERALRILEKALGPAHPTVAVALVELGRDHIDLKQLDKAGPILERARAVINAVPNASPHDRTAPLLGLGELYLARHEPARAASVIEEAIALNDAQLEGELRLQLADARWQANDRARARTAAEDARATYERQGNRAGVAEAAQWLAQHANHATR